MVLLKRATPEQIIESWRLNSVEWGDDLTAEEHIGREQAQYATYADPSFSQSNWVLVEDENSSDILCACETLFRPAIISRVVDGKRVVETGAGYGIASVFCRASLRGRGYASQMMKLLSDQLRKENFLGGALWSDIGPVFYARFGWKAYPSRHSSVAIATAFSVPILSGSWLDNDTLLDICERDCAAIVDEVKHSSSENTIWSFLPSYDVMRWHHARMSYVFKLRLQKNSGSLPSQLPHLSYSVSKSAWCTWTMQFTVTKPVLYILRLRYDSVEELSELLQAAAVVAKNHKMSKIVIWDPQFQDLKAVAIEGLKVEDEQDRTDSLSALQINSDDKDVEWLYNEKFCWC